jgi:soluble lytic murein transglycosylase
MIGLAATPSGAASSQVHRDAARLASALQSRSATALAAGAQEAGPLSDLFRFHLARRRLDEGDAAAAEGLLGSIEPGPAFGRAQRALVELWSKQKQYDKIAAAADETGLPLLSPLVKERQQLLRARALRKAGKHTAADDILLDLAGGRRKGAASREALQDLYRRYRAGRFAKIPSKPALLLRFADVLFQHRKYPHVVDLTNRVIRSPSVSTKLETAEAYLLQGQVYEKKRNRWFAAKQYAQAASRFGPGVKREECFYKRGAIFVQLKQPARARKELAKVLDGTDAYAGGALWHLAQLDLKSGKRTRALNRFRELARKSPKSYFAPKALWRVARELEKSKTHQEAKDAFLAFVAAFPKHRLANAARYRAGRAAFDGKAIRTAHDLWTQCLQVPVIPDMYSLFAAQRLSGVHTPSFAARHGPGWELLLARYPADTSTRPRWIRPGPGLPAEARARLDALRSAELIEDLQADLVYWTGTSRGRDFATRATLAWAHFRRGDYRDAVGIFETRHADPTPLRPEERGIFFSGMYPEAFFDVLGKWAEKYAVHAPLTYSIAREESHFAPDLQSWANARGLMQVIPSTARWIAQMLGRKRAGDLYDPNVSAELGNWYLNHLMKMFKEKPEPEILSIAGYNGGPGNVKRWLRKKGVKGILPWLDIMDREETFYYVFKVTRSMLAYEATAALRQARAAAPGSPATRDL